MNITLGSTVTVEVIKTPTNDAAHKTLIRLFRKDASVARHHRHQQSKRPSWEFWRRGGMSWHHQMKTKPAVSLQPGSKYQIRATVDVVRDLASVERFVRVG
jgi:hypothetical protein